MTKTALFLKDIEVAIRYNISRATVWRWADQGKIPKPFKLGSGSSRWSIVDLERWESSKSSKEDK